MASRTSQRGLDLLNFFTANVQTGFGPFIAAFLTANKWTQSEIGMALSVGTLTMMLSQLPAGAAMDAARNKRLAAAAALLAIAGAALILGLWPSRLPVVIAEVLHGFASCALAPAIAAISLALVGRAAMGERLGRNARWGSIGNGIAAALMGACGEYVSRRAVFWLTAALTVPALFALLSIRPGDLTHGQAKPGTRQELRGWWRLFLDRRLLAFAGCVVLFHLSNAAMLTLAAGEATERMNDGAQLVIAACIVVPQLIVALISPWVGRAADRWGRRSVLLLGFAALPLRGLALAVLPHPLLLVPIQALDGVSGAVFGIMLPLVSADLTRGRNGFNLCMGALGLAAGMGATLSTTFAGRLSDGYGNAVAFLGLAGAGLAACLLVWATMPETVSRALVARVIPRPRPSPGE